MPIVKRSSLPSAPAKRVPKTEQYRLPGKPLEAVLKELHMAQSDAEWIGDWDKAENYKAQADEVRERIDNGELYEVNH